jgi:hypothetical protein
MVSSLRPGRARRPRPTVSATLKAEGDLLKGEHKKRRGHGERLASVRRNRLPRAREDQDADSGDQRNDVKEFVDEVDEEVPDEHLETRVDETVDNRAEPSSD